MADYVKGLDGVIAAQTAISLVDGQAGRLAYRGYEIAELARERSFEEVAHLLWYGALPAAAQLDEIAAALGAERRLGSAAQGTLEAMSLATHPIDVLRTVISAQAASGALETPDLAQAIGTAASIPTILAAFHRRRAGFELPDADPALGHAASYLRMLSGTTPAPEQARALDAYLVMLADHGMNASTFTARVIASTGSDLASCLVGAVGALKGPLHGGAPSEVMRQIEEVRAAGDVERWASDLIARRGRFMGFGHAVYRTYDPRAVVLRELCRELNPEFFETASELETVVLRILAERHPDRPQATNVEFYSAGVLEFVGLPADLFTPTFALARAVGWSAHVLEQVAQQREGTAKIFRPQSQYIGPERHPAVAGAS
jgi:citrate synthase